MLDVAGPRHRATPQGHTAGPRRRATVQGHGAEQQCRARPQGHSEGPRHRAMVQGRAAFDRGTVYSLTSDPLPARTWSLVMSCQSHSSPSLGR